MQQTLVKDKWTYDEFIIYYQIFKIKNSGAQLKIKI
jgi:hypothetical protein